MLARSVLSTVIAVSGLVAAVLFVLDTPADRSTAVQQETVALTGSYIIKADALSAAAKAVREVGGKISHELGIIRAVAAELTADQVATLRVHEAIRRVYGNEAVEVASASLWDPNSSSTLDSYFPMLVNAGDVHAMGVMGEGIGVAVLDTGLWKVEGIKYDSAGDKRIVAVYNAIEDQVLASPMAGDDWGGHGTHVASIAVSSLRTDSGLFNGIAPDSHLISVQAFDEQGQGTYADVIRAIDWVVKNRKKYKVRVLNLSFSAEPRSHYWDDPINQAVMVAWQKEIFVVAAAGNRGPDPMTIGVPGNVPYVMTVGAMTDSYTPDEGSDDVLASFSSAGPTYEGFVKPEVVAPGGHMLGLVHENSYLANTYPEYYVGDRYFQMSGTSQATAVVSGIAALALQAEPWRTVDELKCKIMSASRPAVAEDGSLAYSVFQQGAGLVDAYAAVMNQTVDCANRGLHISNDVGGTQHFGGRANQMDDGTFYLMGLDGYLWSEGYLWSDGYLWTDSYLWTDGYLWADSYLWTDGVGVDSYLWTDGFLWTDGYLWTEGYLWTDGYLWTEGLTETTTMSRWVGQE